LEVSHKDSRELSINLTMLDQGSTILKVASIRGLMTQESMLHFRLPKNDLPKNKNSPSLALVSTILKMPSGTSLNKN